MPTDSWADRLAYLRWRWAAGAIKATDLAFAQALGVTTKWYSKWKSRPDAPPGREEQKAIAAQLGRDVADWLYDGTGVAPEPTLWLRWTDRGAAPYHGTEPRQEKKPARVAKKRPGRKAS